jgi:hypothetical protein
MPMEIKRKDRDESGVFCHARLEDGELIRITIAYGPVVRLGTSLPSAPIGLVVDTLRWGGLKKGYDVFRFDLRPESNAGRFAQLPLIRRSDVGVDPLIAVIDYLKDCRTVIEVKKQCDALEALPVPAHGTADQGQDD